MAKCLDLDAIAELIRAELDDDDAAHARVRADLVEDPDLVPGSVWLLVVERLRANQLPDGGEWTTWYGSSDDPQNLSTDRHRADNIQYRAWYGPVEPIGATDG